MCSALSLTLHWIGKWIFPIFSFHRWLIFVIAKFQTKHHTYTAYLFQVSTRYNAVEWKRQEVHLECRFFSLSHTPKAKYKQSSLPLAAKTKSVLIIIIIIRRKAYMQLTWFTVKRTGKCGRKKKHDHYTDYRIEYMPSRANGIKNKLLKYFKFNFNGELKGSTTKWMELNESINGQSLNKQKFIKYMDNERKSSWIFNNGE